MDRSYSAFVGASGTATLIIVPDKSGIQWVVAQISVDCSPSRPEGNATVRKNGQYVTSTITLPQTAGGEPALLLQYFDTMTITFSGCQPGDNVIGTVYYNEVPWGYPLVTKVV